MNHPAPQPDTPAGTAAQGATQATDKAPKGQADAASTSETLKDQETKWRKQFQDAYAKLARLEKELDILQREGDKAQTQYYSDPQKALTEQYTRKEINDKDTKIAAKQQEIAQMKQQISDMQDQLRKAGGDPGWGTP
jgi:predicted RNase H-like nuclease (RuvC/YqgF family)